MIGPPDIAYRTDQVMPDPCTARGRSIHPSLRCIRSTELCLLDSLADLKYAITIICKKYGERKLRHLPLDIPTGNGGSLVARQRVGDG
jgi:hypothetical protein